MKKRKIPPFGSNHNRRMIENALKKVVMAKGKSYYLYREILNTYLGDDLCEAIHIIRDNKDDGLVSFADLCGLLVYFQFPSHRMQTMVDILEHHRVVPARAYNKVKHLGVKKSLITLGYEKCPNPDCWRWYFSDSVCACQKVMA